MGKIVDKNEFWFIEKNPITKVGVFPYLGKQISQDCEPNKIYYVLRPKEELFKKETLDSLKLLPLVDEHTMLGKDFTAPEDKGIDGILGEQVVHDNDTIYTDIKIFSEDMKEKIRDGKKELSLGYFCTYDKQEGTYKGQRYDYIQKDIIGNHLALVDKGRMGSEVRVYDSKVYTCDSLEGIDIEKLKYKNDTGEDEMAEEIKKVEAKDEDKRKLIDEIGGILKDKVSEEVWRTIVGKLEKIAYNGSEASKATDEKEDEEEKKEVKDKCAKDKCSKDEEKVEEKVEEKEVKDEDKDDEEKKDKKSEDEDDEEKKDKKEEAEDELPAQVIEMIAERDNLAKEVSKVIGTFDYSAMTTKKVAKYACDKLDLQVEEGQEISALKGYLKGVEKNKVVVSVKAEDSATVVSDTSFDNYMKNAKK